MLAEGYTIKEVSAAIEVGQRSIYRWKADSSFQDEVDRLTLTAGIATTADRLRIIKRVLRQNTVDGEIKTRRDVLEWLKLAHDETNKQSAVLALNINGYDEQVIKIYGNNEGSGN